MRLVLNIVLFALLPLLISIEVKAQTDSLHMSLEGTTLVGEKHSSMVKAPLDGPMQVDIKQMQKLPKILGNTDPLNFIRLLPGVQTVNETNNGIYIQGCDAAHNDISAAGVQLFGVNHMFGFFSVFNPEHYSQMSFSHSASSNMLGGALRMELPQMQQEKVKASAAVGMMSTQGSLGVRIGEKSMLKVSARQSYMNLLYGRLMRLSDAQITYGFGDYNLTYLWDSGAEDKVWIDSYFGMDRAGVSQSVYSVGVNADWGNYLGALHWEHKGENITHRHSLSSSGYKSLCHVLHADATADLTSYINAAGYKGELSWRWLRGRAELMYYRAMPQHPVIKGMFNTTQAEKLIQNAVEGTAVIGYDDRIGDDFHVKAYVKGILYHNKETGLTGGVTPDLTLSYDAHHWGKVSLSYAWQQQNLSQVGISNVGLPIQFWFLSGKYNLPQYSQNASMSYNLEFCRSMFDFSMSLYYKRLYNQVQYNANLFDFFMEKYDLNNVLLKGSGWNYGLNAMLHKKTGDLTGWVSYSLGRALRRFNNQEYTGIYPANHERIHEFNAVCMYDYRNWDFSGTFVCASGLPFTAPESYYLSSGKLIVSYGEHNACRMRPYIRLDLSATYSFNRSGKYEDGINLSIYNVLARKNEVLYRLHVTKDNKYAYVSLAFMLKFVPSISYYIKF